MYQIKWSLSKQISSVAVNHETETVICVVETVLSVSCCFLPFLSGSFCFFLFLSVFFYFSLFPSVPFRFFLFLFVSLEVGYTGPHTPIWLCKTYMVCFDLNIHNIQK